MSFHNVIDVIGGNTDRLVRVGDVKGNLRRLSDFLDRAASGGLIHSPTIIMRSTSARGAGTATCGTVAAGNTYVVNGVTLTATKHRASGTLTLVSAIATDIAEVGGVNFVGQASAATLGTATFDTRTGNTEAAASLAAQINAHATTAALVTAHNVLGVVTVRAIATGAGGDAITISSPDATITASAATLAGGAAVGANQFDVGTAAAASSIESATDLARCVNASVTALVQYVVQACNFSGTLTSTTAVAGNVVYVCGYKFTGKAGATLEEDQFCIDTGNTETATSLAAQINARHGLRNLVVATSSTNVVTVRQLTGTSAAGTLASGASTIVAVTLAATAVVHVTAIQPGLSGNCVTTTATGGVTASAARLVGGTETRETLSL